MLRKRPLNSMTPHRESESSPSHYDHGDLGISSGVKLSSTCFGTDNSNNLVPMKLSAVTENPLVSVLVANYNYSRYLGAAIESVLAQSYGKFEVCICDDGSTDNSIDVVKSYISKDKRVRLFEQKNQGVAVALNSAWSLARGELIALLDADDIWLPTKLELVVKCFVDNPGVGLVTHYVTPVRSNLSVIAAKHPQTLAQGWLAASAYLNGRPPLPPASGLTFHWDLAKEIFPIPAIFRANADGVLQDRALLLAPVGAVTKALSLYRIHGDNLTGYSRPTSVAEIRKAIGSQTALRMEADRFAAQRLGLQGSDSRPLTASLSSRRLAELLLLGEPVDSALLDAVPNYWHRCLWEVLFVLPHSLSCLLLKLWWTESQLKLFCASVLAKFDFIFRSKIVKDMR